MAQKNSTKAVILMLAFGIAITMTAVTATVSVDNVEGSGTVDVEGPALSIDNVDVTASPTGFDGTTFATEIGPTTTASGADRFGVEIVEAQREDTVEVEPDLENVGDSSIFVQVTTNTSDSVTLDGYSNDLAPIRGTVNEDETAIFQIEVDSGTTETPMLEYEVAKNATSGSTHIGVRADAIGQDGDPHVEP